MASKIKTIIFDIDGTLIDTFENSVMALREAILDITGQSYNEDELSFHFGITLDDALRTLKIDETCFDAIATKVDEYYGRKKEINLFEGIESMIEQLSENGYIIGIVTSKQRTEYIKDFSDLSIAKYFETIVCADDTEKHKPHPEPIEKFIQLTKTKKEEAIYIGDTSYDCSCAHKAGIKFGLAVWGARNNKIKADYFFTNPTDILKEVQ